MTTTVALLLAMFGAAGAVAAGWPQPWPQPWPPPAEQPEADQEQPAAPKDLSASAWSYRRAYEQFQSGRPMICVLSAKWCGPCQRLKASYRKLERLGTLAVIDVDAEPTNARALVNGAESFTIPRIVYWHPDGTRYEYGPEHVDRLLARIR